MSADPEYIVGGMCEEGQFGGSITCMKEVVVGPNLSSFIWFSKMGCERKLS